MTQLVKAIETTYSGVVFRSRREARWAVFFNEAGLSWQYEPEGYELPHGPYLPDFWLPDSRTYLEIKGDLATQHEIALAYDLAQATDCTVLIAACAPSLGHSDWDRIVGHSMNLTCMTCKVVGLHKEGPRDIDSSTLPPYVGREFGYHGDGVLEFIPFGYLDGSVVVDGSCPPWFYECSGCGAIDLTHEYDNNLSALSPCCKTERMRHGPHIHRSISKALAYRFW